MRDSFVVIFGVLFKVDRVSIIAGSNELQAILRRERNGSTSAATQM